MKITKSMAAARKSRLIGLMREARDQGQRNYWAVLNYVSKAIVCIELDSEQNILGKGEARLALNQIEKATDLKKSTVLRHLQTAIERGVIERTHNGNAQGKRGRGASSYKFGVNGFRIQQLFKSRLLFANAKRRANAQSFNALTLEGCREYGLDKKGRQLFSSPEGSIFFLRRVRRKVCCTRHRSRCRNHKSRFRWVDIPHIVANTKTDLQPLTALGRKHEEWRECEKCDEVLDPSRVHSRTDCVANRSDAKAARQRKDDFIRERTIGSIWIGRRKYYRVLVRGRVESSFEREWLSPSQRLVVKSVDYGFSPLQRADILCLARKMGTGQLLQGGSRYPFLAYLGDRCGTLRNHMEDCGEAVYWPLIERGRLTEGYALLKRLCKDAALRSLLLRQYRELVDSFDAA